MGSSVNHLGILVSFKLFHINPDWRVIFEKSGPFELKKNALLKTLPRLNREWMVEFEFKPTNFEHGWTSIFQMFAGDNSPIIGKRIPAVFYHPRRGLHICSHINETNYCRDFPSSYSPAIGNWTKIRVSQELHDKKFKYRIFVLAFN